MHDNGKYCLPKEIVTLLEVSNLSFSALRLFHGLYHQINLHTGGNPALMGVQSARPSTIHTSALYGTVGPRGAKDASGVRRAIADLTVSGFFLELALTANARGLTFRFSRKITDGALGSKRHALLQTAWIAGCASATEILFRTRVAMHCRQDYPCFDLPGISSSAGAAWTASREKWINAAQKLAKILPHVYLIAPIVSPRSITVDRVTVKMIHKEAKWEPGSLYRFSGGPRAYEITASGSTLLSKDDLRAKSMLTSVPIPAAGALADGPAPRDEA